MAEKTGGDAGSLFALNESAAEAFLEIADLLEIKGENPFKIKAYVKASRVLRDLEQDLEELAAAGQLTSIPGVGKAIADKLEAFLHYGSIPQLEQLREEIPPGLIEVAALPGLGAKKTSLFYQELGVVDLVTLHAALLEDKVAALKGFSKASQAKILSAVEKTLSNTVVYVKSRLEEWAAQTLERLQGLPGVSAAEVVGAVRRCSPESSNLELLLHCINPVLASEGLAERLRQTSVSFDQESDQFRFLHPAGCPLIVHLRPLKQAGWSSLELTGPVSFVHEMRSRLSGAEEWASEEELFSSLGLAFIPPELRERSDCFELDQDALLTVESIKGNLHAHTTDSDGESPLEEMAAHAVALGHTFLAVTDHSRSLMVAGGLTPERLLAQVERVRSLERAWDSFTLFAGCEVDILEEGNLDYDDSILEKLDFAVGAVHSFFHLSRERMTKRLLMGLSHPKVKIFAHPTGRLISKREGYQADWEVVFELCARRGVAVEINSSPWRLDLAEDLLELALAKGCLVAVNTDAHSKFEFDYVRHGVDIARRAGLPAQRVVNCWEIDRLKAWMRSDGK